jgi:IclR family pca regulon transcriptional regulator
MANSDSESFVRTFARGLQIIETLGKSKHGMTIAELSESTGLSRSVVKRYLLTLIEIGYMESDGKTHSLTPKVLSLGLSYLYSLPYWRHAQFALEELSQAIEQSCAMSILDHADIIYVVRIPKYKILRASPTLGSRLPANAVSMGRILLAEQSETELEQYLEAAPLHRLTNQTIVSKDALRDEIHAARTKGYAWVNGELDESICGLAIAVKNLEGKAIGAVNVSLPAGKIDEEQAVARYLGPLRNAAAQIRSSM